MKHSLPFLLLLSALLCAPAGAEQPVQATLTLTNGDTLRGVLVRRESDVVVVRHDLLGELRVPESRIAKTVIATAAPAPAGAKAPKSAADEAQQERLLAALLPDWERQFDLGISGSEGNSQSQNIHSEITAKAESEERRWDVQLAYDSAEEDGEQSRQEFFTEVNRDWLTPGSPHYYFATGRYDWDDFQDWDYRVNGAGGYGYEFVNRPDWTLRGKAGLGASREFGGEEDELAPEGLLGLESKWKLSEHHSVEFASTVYPRLDEAGEFRNLTALQWVNKLNSTMRLKIGLTNEYDSDVADDTRHNDFKYITSLSWDI